MTNKPAVKQDTALVVGADAPSGFEDVDSGEFMVPRLKLLQDLSDAVKKRKSGKAGQFENSISEEVMDGPLELVCVSAKNGAVYLVQGEGKKCGSPDGITSDNGDCCKECPYDEYWGAFKGDEPPKCSGTVDIIVIPRSALKSMLPESEAMLVSFMKTSRKIGRRLISMARATGKPLYARSYNFNSVEDHHKKGDFFNFKIDSNPWLSQDEFNVAAQLCARLQGMKIKTNDDDLTDTNDTTIQEDEL